LFSDWMGGTCIGLFERKQSGTEKPLKRCFSREALGNFWTSIPRLVFLFLGGFLLGCHEVFPPLNDFVLPRFDRAP
jgi:hypothetical protein